MKKNLVWKVVAGLLVTLIVASACAPKAVEAPVAEPAAEEEVVVEEAPAAEAAPAEPEEFNFGMLLVGPKNDGGWSQAHYDGGLYAEEKVPGAKMQYLENVYVGAGGLPQGVTEADVASDMVSKSAKLVIFNSDAMQDKAIEFAKANPEIPVIHASGDSAWQEGVNYVDVPNLFNVMGRMEYGKMMAGCVAALTTQTGKIGYLGPLINSETRRFASSAYLGAKYCWTNYLGKDAADLEFKVTWIGFWFYIPGVSTDPTQVADDFYNTGYDVVLSGIDTTEALVEAGKLRAAGKTVWAIPYDYKDACAESSEFCLGVPYFNWGPSYAEQIKKIQDGTFKAGFDWAGPDWNDINDPDTSMVGFTKGAALSAEASSTLDKFIAELAGGLNLFAGPMNYQDGSVYLKDGENATDQQIWYLPQLLEGMDGQSVSQ